MTSNYDAEKNELNIYRADPTSTVNIDDIRDITNPDQYIDHLIGTTYTWAEKTRRAKAYLQHKSLAIQGIIKHTGEVPPEDGWLDGIGLNTGKNFYIDDEVVYRLCFICKKWKKTEDFGLYKCEDTKYFTECLECKTIRFHTYHLNQAREHDGDPDDPVLIRHAHRAVMYGIKAGVLARPTRCSDCHGIEENVGMIQAHHEDYTKPMEIIWLCQSCHSEEDARLREARGINRKIGKTRKLTPLDYQEIYQRYEDGESMSQIAQEMGISISTISRIMSGEISCQPNTKNIEIAGDDAELLALMGIKRNVIQKPVVQF